MCVCVCVSSASCTFFFLARHGSLCGASLEIISFFLQSGPHWALVVQWTRPRTQIIVDCAAMNAWDSTSSKVCTDNCYYLISTIWKETIIIRGFDWDVKRRETNVCFVALYTFVFLCAGSVFMSRALMRSLFQEQSQLHIWENIHVCPHPPSSSAIPVSWNNALHWRHEMDGWNSSTYTCSCVCTVSSLKWII